MFVYDLAGKLKRQMRNPRDGWGLSNDGTNLMFTDGGPSLYYADPKTFKIGKAVNDPAPARARSPASTSSRCVDGKLYGNIFTTRSIVRFDPETGCIDAVADLGVLWEVMTPEERASTNSPRTCSTASPMMPRPACSISPASAGGRSSSGASASQAVSSQRMLEAS